MKTTVANRLNLEPRKHFGIFYSRYWKGRLWVDQAHLRGCLPKILKPILDYITDFLETLCVIYTLVG